MEVIQQCRPLSGEPTPEAVEGFLSRSDAAEVQNVPLSELIAVHVQTNVQGTELLS